MASESLDVLPREDNSQNVSNSYTPTTDELSKLSCDANDKECQNRWIQAIADCC